MLRLAGTNRALIGVMTRLALVIGLLWFTSCRDGGNPGSPSPDGAPPGSRVVENCVMNVELCPSRYCLSQGDGIFLCACPDQPAGADCPQACPPGYRYHGKYASCEPTCEALTCKASERCEDFMGVATCMPTDAGAEDTRPPPARSCISGPCNADETCLQTYSEQFGPNGITCGPPAGGLAECRTVCTGNQTCPASRPHCRMLLPGGCSSPAAVCCANSDARTVYDCF